MANDTYWEDDLDDEFQDECIFEQEQAILLFAQDFYRDVKTIAKGYMEQFFKDKMFHCGGKIPRSILFADKRLSIVLDYDIIKGVDEAYKMLEHTVPTFEIEASKFSGDTTSDIRRVNEILDLLSRSGIPQQFAGGMMILYLELIEGF